MPDLKLTEEELKIIFAVKKRQLTYKNVDNFLDLFCFLLEKDFFICKGGKKTAFFDGEGTLRQIGTEQIDWKL